MAKSYDILIARQPTHKSIHCLILENCAIGCNRAEKGDIGRSFICGSSAEQTHVSTRVRFLEGGSQSTHKRDPG
jgi:hypothetical protein